MNSKYLRICCLVLAIFVIQISCKSVAKVEEAEAPKDAEVAVPEAGHVKQNVEIPAEAPQPAPATTRRPGIVLGIWNGIVRAPAEIANRVQGIFAGINARRNATTTAVPKARLPSSAPAKALEEVKVVN